MRSIEGSRPGGSGALSFRDLYREEQLVLDEAAAGASVRIREDFVVATEESDEPHVESTPVDRVGLALSGGGIRSATFNLGLLQALNSYGILGQVDYLSTVSGGGYIGGWWTAWRARPGGGGAIFPGSGTVADPRSHPDAEPPEVRHLREFSNFLSPRWGFFQSEMWNSLLAVVGGLVPALMVALSCLGLVLFLWLAMTAYLAGPSTPFALGLFCGIAAVVLAVREFRWRRMGKADPTSTGAATAIALSAVGVAAVGAAWLIWFRSLQSVSGLEWPLYFDGFWRTHARAWSMDAWLSAIGAVAEHDRWHLNPRLFEGAFVWLAVGLILLPLRLLFQSIRSDELRRKAIPAIDRVMERFLGLGIGWALVALIWTAGSNLHTVGPVKIGTALAAAGSAGLFAWLRRWLVSSFGSARTGGFMETLKPLIPQVLAYVTVILMGVIVAGVSASWLEWMQDDPMRWMMVLGTMSIVVLVSMLLDPAEFGLHAFYRNRIARAYLGASNPAARGPASENRQTDLRRGDDLPFEQARLRPLHLVCCAANDLAGDRLSNLSRGARSATLSCHGLAIGDDWAGKPGLRLGSAVTASAAAFNSSMGSVSARLGPAVSFLMSALNLRLGLWARHPLSRSLMRDRVPGLLFLQEMAGHTHAGTRKTPRGREPLSRFVHLSDGGHFENLALYELVRRHCRYIIVSDCGADPGVLFDDLGNAVRRIREDFGVEIEIDVGPLRPGPDGISRQHMVVGAIRYTPEDHGILLLFKPALTGDEPTDVQQYKSRNRAFPHESTGDQFYDEAQWEAYRRLGEHAAHSGLRFVEWLPTGVRSAQDLFGRARTEWYPAPDELEGRFLDLTGRYAEVEETLREAAPEFFVREIFPELASLAGGSPGAAGAAQPAEADLIAALHCVIRMLQLMEDVFVGCMLDTHWNHPINLGWLNGFQRWSGAPTFRMWWPLLRPMYGPRFRRFAEDKLGLGGGGAAGAGGLAGARYEIVRSAGAIPEGLARRRWLAQDGALPGAEGRTVFSCRLLLERPSGDPVALQVGIAVVEIRDGVAHWSSDLLFVPPSLWGGGIGSRLLWGMLERLETSREASACRVVLRRAGHGGQVPTDRGSREEFLDLLNFYKAAGFVFSGGTDRSGNPIVERALYPAKT